MANKKERIIAAAQQVFLAQGIDKTKVSDIVKLAGIAQGTFYLYFPTKAAVMPEIAKQVIVEILAYLQQETKQSTSAEEQLNDMIDAMMRFNLEQKDRLQLLYAGLAKSEYIGEWEEIYSPFYDWVTQLIVRGQQEQTMYSDLDAFSTARILIGTIESTAEQLYLFDKMVDEAFAAQQIRTLKVFVRRALGIQ
ncbi:TetR family transcriptional regulator [Kurthia huakuii]|uniref:TetR family transcriptional regulator n=1 Tax=Kurthia huakuii TaxID=1421019 RepID=UPI00049858EA|nr:TetR family transcriptional regulator [Kurthia huakuii]MBM7699814.1 AcrR family transcriptional regulator [Kurthia huakuii]